MEIPESKLKCPECGCDKFYSQETYLTMDAIETKFAIYCLNCHKYEKIIDFVKTNQVEIILTIATVVFLFVVIGEINI